MVQTGFTDLFAQNRVRIADNLELLFRDFAHDADRKTRARERLTPDNILIKANFQAHLSDFILKEVSQRLNQLKLHILREAAHIVVAFDDLSGIGAALNDVRIDGALNEPLDPLELVGLFLENADKLLTG